MSFVSKPMDSNSSKIVTETINGSHEFTLQGYSLTKGIGTGNYVCSDKFNVGGHEWAIYFYPDGKNREDHLGYVSVFVALASETSNVRAVFQITLIDQSGKQKHKVHKHRSLDSGPYTLSSRGSMWGYKRFFKRYALETSDYLKDDCLKILCTIGVVVSAKDCPRLCSIPVPESNIGARFRSLLENREALDVIFNVAGEKFHGHKLIFAARSLVFRSKLFDGSAKDNQEIVIGDVEPEVFKALLHFVYHDTLTEVVDEMTPNSALSETLVAKLLVAANNYGLDRLRLLCESRLSEDITVESVTDILALADNHHAAQLKAVCLKFAAENLAAVMESDGFQHFKENCKSLQSELLMTVAGCDVDCSSGEETSQSVCA